MTFDIEKFCAEAAAVMESPAHREFIGARLPNEGEDLRAICETGIETLREHSARLNRIPFPTHDYAGQ